MHEVGDNITVQIIILHGGAPLDRVPGCSLGFIVN